MKLEISDDMTKIHLTIPSSFKRRGSRRLIIAPDISIIDGRELPKEPIKDEKLIKTLVRAFQWQEWIDTGKYSDIKELAQKEKTESTYAARVIRLTLLAPDIIESILDGTQPRDLTLQKVIRGFPCSWPEQRAKFGFSEPISNKGGG